MRKFTGVSAAIFTFSLGVSIYFVFLSFAVDKSKSLVEPVESSSLPLISLCEAKENYEFYESRDIRLRANFYVDESGRMRAFELKKDCTGVTVTFRDENNEILSENELDSDILKLAEELSAKNSGELKAVVGVELIGELEHSGILCNFIERNPFYFRARQLRRISPVKIIDVSAEFDRINNYRYNPAE
jgi:hypothetical protein